MVAEEEVKSVEEYLNVIKLFKEKSVADGRNIIKQRINNQSRVFSVQPSTEIEQKSEPYKSCKCFLIFSRT